MTIYAATKFTELWTFLGNNHADMDEESLIAAEQKLFELKAELNPTDYTYIVNHVDQNKVIQKALLHFLP